MTLDIHKLVAGYRAGPVLHEVTLSVADREFVSVLGVSGSGKTTLLRTVAGLHPPTSGRVILNGRDVTDLKPERRRIGLVPQEGALFGHLTVAENVAFGLRGGRWTRRDRRRVRVGDLLSLVELAGYLDRMPHELSGGQRQRVAVARALAVEPDLVLLDEPFASLDSSLRADVRAQVRTALQNSSTTAVLITHDQDEALSISDRVAVLHEGRIVQYGTAHDLYCSPRTPWIAAFVGDALLLTGRSDGRCMNTPLGAVEHQLIGPGEVTAVIRPEQIGLHPPAAPDTVTAVVGETEYFGHDQLVRLTLADGTRCAARAGGSARWPVGAEVGIQVAGPIHVIADR